MINYWPHWFSNHTGAAVMVRGFGDRVPVKYGVKTVYEPAILVDGQAVMLHEASSWLSFFGV